MTIVSFSRSEYRLAHVTSSIFQISLHSVSITDLWNLFDIVCDKQFLVLIMFCRQTIKIMFKIEYFTIDSLVDKSEIKKVTCNIEKLTCSKISRLFVA